MTPFLQFRVWFRRASAGQRVAAGLGVALLAGLLIWSAVPSSNPGSTVVGVGQPTGVPGATATTSGPTSPSGQTATTLPSPGGTLPPGTLPGGVGTQPGVALPGGTASTLGPTPTPGPATTGPTTTNAPQSCAKRGQLRVGVVVPEGGGGALNPVIGAPPTSQEEADYAAALDSVNKAGGVDCNDLVGDFATSDLTNPSGVQAGCLRFVQDKVFAVLGGFLPTFTDDCLLQAHLPTFDELPIPAGQVKQFYPYYFSTYPSYEVLYRNFVDAVDQLGYFGASKHFGKLGIFYRDCVSEVNQALLSDLAAVGVSGNKVDRFDLGCPGSFASPSAVEEGVVKFRADGVTTVTIDNDLPDIQQITNVAHLEEFKPVGGWILADLGSVSITGSANFHPFGSEFDGAVAITSEQYGAIASGLPETPGTRACDQVMTSHDLPTVYQSGDQFAGSACSLVWMLEAAIQHAGVTQTRLPAGLQAARTPQASFPTGPSDFSAPGTTTGGQFWRTVTYHASCGCWTVVNPTWRASFP